MTDARQPRVCILTDGKAGDEQPLIGVAEAMGAEYELRRVAPRKLFAALMPWGPIDPREAGNRPGSPLAPPYPDICLATGRRAIAYLRTLKRRSPDTLCVCFKDPRTSSHGADLVVVQAHDRLRGKHVLVTLTAPNRISVGALEAHRQAPPAALSGLASPRIAVLIGGDSRHHTFTPGDIERLVEGLRARRDQGGSLMMTASRRTPEPLRQALQDLVKPGHAMLWDGKGDNPFLAFLALADEIVVTADSTNMLGEAASTGRPLQVFHPSGGHPKIDRFVAALSGVARVGEFPDRPASGSYPPLNATQAIAGAILDLWRQRS